MNQQRFLSVLAVLCLLAIPLAAQQTLEEAERRTEPAARVLGPDPGLTLTGTVDELGDEHMWLKTIAGRQIMRLGDAPVPAGLSVGDRVAVDYSRTATGVMIARQIRPFELGAALTVTGTVVEITEQELVVRTDVGVERFQVGDAELPAGLQPGDQVVLDFTSVEPEIRIVERVRPHVTISGTVVEITDRELVVRTDAGLERFRIEDADVLAGVSVGDRITVSATRGGEGVMVAQAAWPFEVTGETGTGTVVDVGETPQPTLEPDVLPATASKLPWIAVFGLFALLAAAASRAARA